MKNIEIYDKYIYWNFLCDSHYCESCVDIIAWYLTHISCRQMSEVYYLHKNSVISKKCLIFNWWLTKEPNYDYTQQCVECFCFKLNYRFPLLEIVTGMNCKWPAGSPNAGNNVMHWQNIHIRRWISVTIKNVNVRSIPTFKIR